MKEFHCSDTLCQIAHSIAEKYHKNQVDKAGMPYMIHVTTVASKVMTCDEHVVALLHDVIEDTECSATDLTDYGIPVRLVRSIEAMTRLEGETYAEFILRVKKDPIARKVKLADLEHNMDETRMSDPSQYPDSLRKRYLKAKKELLDIS
ncbi:GTP pyrophosphokinase [Rossellomorea marisflavi]|uniref:GTP pyrophosphokinase n=1 Tax=Rossellomorea marisflavi TaxID=189381 RepID=UPI003F9F2CEC